ncbi:hydrogenase maturation protease [Anaerosolibacter carboniphilus]|uniref:Hydrogenase maturation protease n=1 Tax=Anaerosolibacter carboniphilus TaxID=1417629 RepID=A0A841L693_9FIRM|nr:hydrogenase maturation protease [Anaerosolibacter carboniphilus]MBB6218612.1 hydrogenase maturation protease [Anaerosolibacter carboniphilus]
MRRKLIAIGNRMMKDDGVAIHIAQHLKDYLYVQDIQLIIGETDVDYCIGQIDDGDDLIILDAAYGEGTPGSIHVHPLENMNLSDKLCFTQHQPSLVEGLRIYKKSVKGVFIGIEVAEISFGLELSQTIDVLLQHICENVKKCIETYVRGKNDA